MVPISSLALAKGTIVNTDEIILSMGADWFVKYSNLDAQKVVQNRIEFINQSIAQNHSFPKKVEGNLHVFGTERNEDGEEYVEIREFEQEDEVLISNPIHVPENTSSTTSPPAQLDEFDRYLIKRLDELELEEKGITQIPMQKADSKPKKVTFDTKVLGKEIVHTDPPSAVSDLEIIEMNPPLNSPPEEPKSKPKPFVDSQKKPTNNKASGNHVLKSNIVVKDLDSSSSDDDIDSQCSLDSKVDEQNSQGNSEWGIDYDESSDEYDPEILRNEVRIHYHKTRQRLISAGLLEPSTTEEEELARQAMRIEQEAKDQESLVFNSSN